MLMDKGRLRSALLDLGCLSLGQVGWIMELVV